MLHKKKLTVNSKKEIYWFSTFTVVHVIFRLLIPWLSIAIVFLLHMLPLTTQMRKRFQWPKVYWNFSRSSLPWDLCDGVKQQREPNDRRQIGKRMRSTNYPQNSFFGTVTILKTFEVEPFRWTFSHMWFLPFAYLVLWTVKFPDTCPTVSSAV